ncbi:MAG: hypothetical protein NDI94_03675 [Candidatus Woesearchaeota archaeon]|nr:hypothetical protein [Candidatus Woesearchaeota archaeon]
MKNSVKKFFLLGLAVAGTAVAVSQIPKVKKAISELVKKKKLSKTHAEELKVDLEKEIKKFGTKKKAAKKVVKKAAKK